MPKEPLTNNCLDTFLCGDLKFLFMMLGREDFDTFWCLYCKLFKDDWQDDDHAEGELWTLQDLKEKSQYNQTNNIKGRERCGVREDPYFNFLHKNIIWPALLHAQIGIGNNLLTYLVEFGDCEIQCLPRVEFKMIQETRQLELDLANAKQEKANWEEMYKPELKRLERKHAQLSEWVKKTAFKQTKLLLCPRNSS